MICSVLAGYVWDKENPFVREHDRQVKELARTLTLKQMLEEGRNGKDSPGNYWINAAAKIGSNRAFRNQEILMDKPELSADEFLVALYREIGMEYPKWFKMDRLSKLGMLAAELALGASGAKLDDPYSA